MSKPWPEVALKDISRTVTRPLQVSAGTLYRTIGVRWWGEGAYERATIDGAQTVAKALSLVKQGDLIINKIWVRHGSTAIASDAVDGCAASGEFPTFELNHECVVPRWIHWLTKTPAFWSKCDSLSRGSSGKNRIRPEIFLTIRVPLPPLPEQKLIVTRIDELADHIDKARSVRRSAAEETAALSYSGVEQWYQRLKDRYGISKVAHLCDSITDGDHITPSFSDEGIRFIFVGNVSSGHLHFGKSKRVSYAYFNGLKSSRTPQRGDILYSAVGATLGIPAIVDSDEPFCFQRHVAILRPNRSKLDSRYAWHMLRSRTVTDQTWASTTGSAQPTVPLRAIRELAFPAPPISQQHLVVAELDALQGKLDALKRLQAETAAELDALLPAVLDRAFNGHT